MTLKLRRAQTIIQEGLVQVLLFYVESHRAAGSLMLNAQVCVLMTVDLWRSPCARGRPWAVRPLMTHPWAELWHVQGGKHGGGSMDAVTYCGVLVDVGSELRQWGGATCDWHTCSVTRGAPLQRVLQLVVCGRVLIVGSGVHAGVGAPAGQHTAVGQTAWGRRQPHNRTHDTAQLGVLVILHRLRLNLWHWIGSEVIDNGRTAQTWCYFFT